jgi:SOS response regulatory protein OraA/RecX
LGPRLSAVARTEHAAILATEKSTTAGYSRLGQVLHLARKQFAHGQWLRYLHELEIEKTRAVKAMRIFESFSTEVQTKELTVAEAYDQRLRRPRPRPQRRNPDAERGTQEVDTPTAVVSSSWPRFAAAIVDEVERRWDETSFLDAAETAAALAGVRQAVAALRRLEAQLRQRRVERNDVTQGHSTASTADESAESR